MFIIFLKSTGEILTYGAGFPTLTESGNKLMMGNESVCNDVANCGWKYIADTHAPSGNAFVYPEVSKPLTDDEIKEQLSATNAVIFDMIMGGA